MGGKFKSIYLSHGRNSANHTAISKYLRINDSCVDNPRLSKLHHILLDLKERPEQREDEFLVADIYSSPIFSKNQSMSWPN